MEKTPDHYTNYTVPPLGSKLMISDRNVYAGEMATVVENRAGLLVRIDATGELVDLIHRNHFNVIRIGYGLSTGTKLTPMQYYATMRSTWHYTPALAAMATMAQFCDRSDYWTRIQRIANFMNGRKDPVNTRIAADKKFCGTISLDQMYNSICHDCLDMHHFHNGNQFYCDQAPVQENAPWPGHLNPEGYMITCPSFNPFVG